LQGFAKKNSAVHAVWRRLTKTVPTLPTSLIGRQLWIVGADGKGFHPTDRLATGTPCLGR
jgi:hypothetical protein